MRTHETTEVIEMLLDSTEPERFVGLEREPRIIVSRAFLYRALREFKQLHEIVVQVIYLLRDLEKGKPLDVDKMEKLHELAKKWDKYES